jgi:hypothetical protein
MIDLVVDRRDMRSVIANALRFMGAKRKEPVARPAPASTAAPVEVVEVVDVVDGVDTTPST